VRYSVPAVTTAASVNTTLGPRSQQGLSRLEEIGYAPDGPIIGQATNFRRVELLNRGPAGTDTDVIASFDFSSAANSATRRVLRALTLNTNGKALIRDGDVLEWRSTAVGSGLADPGGTIITVETAL
jgi:hypothetical protein